MADTHRLTTISLQPDAAPSGKPVDLRRQAMVMKLSALQVPIFSSANFSSVATDAIDLIQTGNVGAERTLRYAAAGVLNTITPSDSSDPVEAPVRAETLGTEFATPIAPSFEALVFKACRGIGGLDELSYIRQDGSRFPVVGSVTVLRDVGSTMLGDLLSGTDNSARKQVAAKQKKLDRALQESKTALQAAQSAVEKSDLAKPDFLPSLGHELRSPLDAMLGFAQLMESGRPPPTPAQAERVAQVLQAGWHSLAQTNEILDLSLTDSGRLPLSQASVSLAEVQTDCQAMNAPQAQAARLQLRFPAGAEPLDVETDRTRVKQVRINLPSNVIKYNRQGATVDITCQAVSVGRGRVSFCETGLGLSAGQLSQLVQRFGRLGQEAGTNEGTGIGLVASKRVVELMGGAIGVARTVGVGSKFWTEPVATEAPQLTAGDQPPGASAESLPQAGGALSMLLTVEDKPAKLLLIEKLIARRPDMRLPSAVDGNQCNAIARAAPPDVVLMDTDLPGSSGLDALRVLADDPATAHSPVVALGGNAMPHDIDQGLTAGFFRSFIKPIRANDVMDTPDVALRAARPGSTRPTVKDTQ